MAGNLPIGQKISLISKSEVRYVGTLYSLDTTQITLTLAKVRSYGTEGRVGDPAKEIKGSDEIYEYIQFKGGDIKDLQVLDDQQHAPPPPGPPQFAPNYPPQGAYGPPGAYPPYDANYGPYGPPPPQPGPGYYGPGQYPPPPQPGYPPQPYYNYPPQQPPPPSQHSQGPVPQQTPAAAPPAQAPAPQATLTQPMQPPPLSSAHASMAQSLGPAPLPQGVQDVAAGASEQGDTQANSQRGRGAGPHSHVARMHDQNARRGGRGGGRGRGQALKFDSEFDFASANEKFNKDDLEKEIEKLKLHDGEEHGDAADAGKEEGEIAASEHQEAEKGKENGVPPVNPLDDLLGDIEVYDSKKSFFDNLSSDVTDRIKMAERGERQPRVDRREERRKDADTFGDDAYRRNGGYRGRGGHPGAHRGGHQHYHTDGQRGGYRGGYAPRGGRGGNRSGMHYGATGNPANDTQSSRNHHHHQPHFEYQSNRGRGRGGQGNRAPASVPVHGQSQQHAIQQPR